MGLKTKRKSLHSQDWGCIYFYNVRNVKCNFHPLIRNWVYAVVTGVESPHFEESGDFPKSHGWLLPVAEPQLLGVLVLICCEAFVQPPPENPDR
jgi:hypothetical protein